MLTGWSLDKKCDQKLRIVAAYPPSDKLVTAVQDKTKGVVTGGQHVKVKVTLPDIVYLKNKFDVDIVRPLPETENARFKSLTYQ